MRRVVRSPVVRTRLTIDDARRIAVRAQLLDGARPTDLLQLVDRLTMLQLDPTAAIAPNADLVDFDLCWAFELVDPWGNRYELNCYEYDRIKAELVEADGVQPDRKWPRGLLDAYRTPRTS